MRLLWGRKDKFWRGALQGTTLSILSGDIGTPGQSETRTYSSTYEAATALMDEEFDKRNRGYFGTSEGLEELTNPEARSAIEDAHAEMGDRDSGRKPLQPAHETEPVTRHVVPPSSGAAARDQEREGPYRASLTGPNVFIPRFAPPPKARSGPDSHPRATSGGQPILAVGQPWPVCGFCDGGPLGLYLQFDIEERFLLPFLPGSHFLLFHCTQCDALPDMPRDLILPASWLDAGHESSYRIILNPPSAQEVAHSADPRMLEQRITFSSSKEKISQTLVGPVGREKVKVGGLPRWVQPPIYPKCACGAPMGFVFQVPANHRPGWRTRDTVAPPFVAGLDAFVFACSVQSHPYAAMMMVQR
jgi:predicted DNA-binding WGR domain protein